MEPLLWGVLILVGIAAGAAGGFFIVENTSKQRVEAANSAVLQLRARAEVEQREFMLQATKEATEIRTAAEAEVRERRQEVQRQERRVQQKEEQLERKIEVTERRETQLTDKEKEYDAIKAQIEKVRDDSLKELERVSSLTTIEAKDMLLQAIEAEVREDANRRLLLLEKAYKEESDRRARDILMHAMQRLNADVIAESTTSTVPIPSEEMKGRIIGREGRNIRALEHATGVDIIIDDTPDAVTLSCFDPVRREIAKLALTKLVADGRIHPSRIEEVVQRAQADIDDAIIKAGEQSVMEVGLHTLHPDALKYLGRLKYRYSYGQNVLDHSIEVTKFAVNIAHEVGANVDVIRRGGLLHDIGKGMDHDMEGPHALIGANLMERYEKSREVIICIAKHHDDWFTNTLEGAIVQLGDAMSGGRPGARAESMERYIKRIQTLEEIAKSYPGVEKSYAVQAGRELRILVKPGDIDDLGAMRLARDIARRVEDSLEYPGQIKVTVVRETRAIEYAQ
ncbi:MAG: ribonuclease Y [Dehalococcoidia bacterium]|nr:ribonuclease Y [Dehalococcoidia bacterium]